VIRFPGWRIEVPLAMVIMVSVLAGIVLTALIGLIQQWKLRSRIRHPSSGCPDPGALDLGPTTPRAEPPSLSR
jgi:hypothetical protein